MTAGPPGSRRDILPPREAPMSEYEVRVIGPEDTHQLRRALLRQFPELRRPGTRAARPAKSSPSFRNCSLMKATPMPTAPAMDSKPAWTSLCS
mgnify:CR=1 FL=1